MVVNIFFFQTQLCWLNNFEMTKRFSLRLAQKRLLDQNESSDENLSEDEEECGEVYDEEQETAEESEESEQSEQSDQAEQSDQEDEELPPLNEIIKFVQQEERREQFLKKKLTSKDGTEWSLTTSSVRHSTINRVHYRPGPSNQARIAVNERALSAVQLFLTDEILFKIATCSNLKANELGLDVGLSVELLKKFLGLQLARAVWINKKTSVSDIWAKHLQLGLFQRTMSRNKFKSIMRILRFDDKRTRGERSVENKFAACSEIWYDVINNFQEFYKPNTNLTIDEQLFATKARSPFTQYMPSKPGKFGIKFWICADSASKYILNAVPYLGRDEARPSGQPLGEFVVKRLMEPYLNLGLNVTTDNFFTTKQLGD